jgi:hypothetical protein
LVQSNIQIASPRHTNHEEKKRRKNKTYVEDMERGKRKMIVIVQIHACISCRSQTFWRRKRHIKKRGKEKRRTGREPNDFISNGPAADRSTTSG